MQPPQFSRTGRRSIPIVFSTTARPRCVASASTPWKSRLAAPTRQCQRSHCGCYFRLRGRKKRKYGHSSTLLTSAWPETGSCLPFIELQSKKDTVQESKGCPSLLRGRYFHRAPVNVVGCHMHRLFQRMTKCINTQEGFIEKWTGQLAGQSSTNALVTNLLNPPRICRGRGCSSVGRASDRHAAEAGSISRCSKGFFFQSQPLVQTLLRCPYNDNNIKFIAPYLMRAQGAYKNR